MTLFRLDSQALFPNVTVSDKSALLHMLAERFAEIYGLDAHGVKERLTERENLGSTGFGRGVAIPHAKMSDLDQPVAMVLRLDKPIGFDAVDSLPVDLIFALLSPEQSGSKHLQALAHASRLMRDEAIVSKLRGASSSDALFALLSDEGARDAA